MSKRKMTDERFRIIKKKLRWHGVKATAIALGWHISTVMKVKNCSNLEQYKEIVRAERPPTKFSLADAVYDIHRILFEKPDGSWIKPRDCKQASLQIKEELSKK